MADKHKNNRSTSLATREMQIKLTLRSHQRPVRVVIIRKHMASEDVGKGSLHLLQMGGKAVRLLWK